MLKRRKKQKYAKKREKNASGWEESDFVGEEFDYLYWKKIAQNTIVR